jgi:hypothetical protein
MRNVHRIGAVVQNMTTTARNGMHRALKIRRNLPVNRPS